MKTIQILFAILICVSCNKKNKTYDLYNCSCPQEILDMKSKNGSIYWDCSWQASYNNGKVSYITDENGKLLSLVRTYKN